MFPPLFEKLIATKVAGRGKVVVGSAGDEKNDRRKPVSFIVNVFFDGTLNNRTNTEERIRNTQVFRDNDEDDSSYDAYYSNVALLEYMNTERKTESKQISVYVEGPGTTDRKGDDEVGYSTGTGYTGIEFKVSRATTLIRNQLYKKGVYDERTERITAFDIRVFGFSRGAAAARNFIFRKQEMCMRLRVPPTAVRYTFIGLFDTVSSFGLSLNFDNDVEELGLRLVDPAIQKVVHLTAGDEYRENFSLTTIASAVAAGKGYELQLPGAHSDIGGGYGEVESEVRSIKTGAEHQRLVTEGWYADLNGREKDIRVRREQRYVTSGYSERVTHYEVEYVEGRRSGITFHYQLIPLEIMVKLATKYGMVFDPSLAAKKANINLPSNDAHLQAARQHLVSLALRNDRAQSISVAFQSPAQMRWVRNRYLHRSASDKLGMSPRLTKDGLPDRKPIPG